MHDAPLIDLRQSANVGDRQEVGHLAEAVQDVTGENVSLAYVDQGYQGGKSLWPAPLASNILDRLILSAEISAVG